MKIISLVTDAYGGFGGISVFNRDLLEALCSHPKVEQVNALPRIIPEPVDVMPNQLVYHQEASRGAISYLKSVAGCMAVGPPPSLIYCGHINLAPIAVWLKRRWNIPILMALFGIEAWQPTERKTANRAMQKVDRFYSISRITRDRFCDWSNTPLDHVDLLPNAIHLDQYGIDAVDPNTIAKFGLAGRTMILTLGRIVSKDRAKGFDEVIEALPQLVQKIPNIVYVIAGDGEYREQLEAKVDRLGVGNHVVFAGRVTDEERLNLYRAAQAYVMPSRGEGFGFVFLEAMACGTPCVASSLDGGRDAVLDGELGALVDPGDREALIRSILEAIEKPRHIPRGLEYFSYPSFERRVHEIIEKMVTSDLEMQA